MRVGVSSVKVIKTHRVVCLIDFELIVRTRILIVCKCHQKNVWLSWKNVFLFLPQVSCAKWAFLMEKRARMRQHLRPLLVYMTSFGLFRHSFVVKKTLWAYSAPPLLVAHLGNDFVSFPWNQGKYVKNLNSQSQTFISSPRLSALYFEKVGTCSRSSCLDL